MGGKTAFLWNSYSRIKIYLAAIRASNLFLADLSLHQKPGNRLYKTWVVKMAKNMLPWRWSLMALLALSVIAVELEEHLPEGAALADELFEVGFVREVVVYGLLFPLMGGVVLEVLAHVQSKRRSVIHQLYRQQKLSRQIPGALEWDELTNLLVKFPRTIAPFIGVFLLVYNSDRTELELAAEWRDPTGQVSPPVLSQMTNFCQACRFAHSYSTNTLTPCYYPDNLTVSEQDNYYCMPLILDTLPVALLHFCLPYGISLTAYQVAVLNSLAPSLALALDNLRPEHSGAQSAAPENRAPDAQTLP